MLSAAKTWAPPLSFHSPGFLALAADREAVVAAHEWCLTSVHNTVWKHLPLTWRENAFQLKDTLWKRPRVVRQVLRDVRGDNAVCVGQEGDSTCCSGVKGLLGQPLHPQPQRDVLLCTPFVFVCFGDEYKGGFKVPAIPGFVKVYFSVCSKTRYSEFIALFKLLQWSKSKLLVLLLHCLLQKFYFYPRTYWLCFSLLKTYYCLSKVRSPAFPSVVTSWLPCKSVTFLHRLLDKFSKCTSLIDCDL